MPIRVEREQPPAGIGANATGEEGDGRAQGYAHGHDHTQAHGHGHANTQAHAHTHVHDVAGLDAAATGANPSHAHKRQCDPGPLVRFSVAMPEELLMRFDALVARRGVAKNRSEVVRDLVRDALIREEAEQVGTEVVGTLTILYDHHTNDVQDTLHGIQHSCFGMIVSTTHVHLDEQNCLEVIIMRGESTEVQEIADRILGTKGVKNGGLVTTTTGQMI